MKGVDKGVGVVGVGGSSGSDGIGSGIGSGRSLGGGGFALVLLLLVVFLGAEGRGAVGCCVVLVFRVLEGKKKRGEKERKKRLR